MKFLVLAENLTVGRGTLNRHTFQFGLMGVHWKYFFSAEQRLSL